MSTSMFCFPIKVFFSCIWQRRAKTDLNSITRLLNVASVCLKGRGDLGLHIDQLDDCGYDINPFAYFFFIIAICLLGYTHSGSSESPSVQSQSMEMAHLESTRSRVISERDSLS